MAVSRLSENCSIGWSIQGLSSGRLLPDWPASQRSLWFFGQRKLNLHLFSLFREFFLLVFFLQLIFSKFAEWCDHHHDPVLEYFHHSKKICCTFTCSESHPTLSHGQPLNYLLFLQTCLFLMSYKWNHIARILHIWLLSCSTMSLHFTHVRCMSMCHSFI